MDTLLSIGMMARLYIPAPKPNDLVYAPISHMIQLAKGLADRGHQITIFAPVGSQLEYPNISIETLGVKPFAASGTEFGRFLANTPLLAHSLDSLQDWYLAKAMVERAHKGEFDLLHFHAPEVGLPLANMFPDVPIVYTLHDPIDAQRIKIYQLFLTPNQHFIAISHHQAKQAKGLPIAQIIHHGMDLPSLDPAMKPDGSLLFVGRIIPEKGVKEAVYVAKKTGRELIIIGPTLPANQNYFDQEIRPHLSRRIRYLGQLNQDELTPYYQRTAALLTPVRWDEPFGLTTIEAMANGAPVISLNRGAAPELIVDQRSGFIVNDLDEMIKAVDRIPIISRLQTRQHIAKNFPLSKTLDDTEEVFRKASASALD